MRNSVHVVNPQNRHAHASCADDAPIVSQIYDRAGNRKYLTAVEHRLFLRAVESVPPELRTFCHVLSHTGARISEVLALTPARIDGAAQLVVVESLKMRRRGVFRVIPLPVSLFEELNRIHHLAGLRRHADQASRSFWTWCRTFVWRPIKEAMAGAQVVGPQASPTGLRHGFAVTAL